MQDGPDPYDLRGRRAVIATMHGKERVIAPVLARMGLQAVATTRLDTDRFGTFTRDVARTGTQRDAARAKAQAALDLHPEADFAIASEGSFGPHPSLPFLAGNAELVLLLSRSGALELEGRHVTAETNYASARVDDAQAGWDFAEQTGFPEHRVVVMAAGKAGGEPGTYLRKGLSDPVELASAISVARALSGGAWIETDMRAHCNPSRMRAIARAAEDLERRWHSRCPDCTRPGWDVTEPVAGRPCARCGTATDLPRAERWACAGCGRAELRPLEAPAADPGHCPSCNP